MKYGAGNPYDGVDFEKMPAEDAAALPPKGEGDGPVEVVCRGKKTLWKSRNAALGFYMEAASWCDGSEAERYWAVASGLELGLGKVSDGAA